MDFYNKSGSITIRRHQLELLHGLGKKHLKAVLDEREKNEFKSMEEISKRVDLMPNPISLIVKRVISELEDDGIKHYQFARPPKKKYY